MNDKINVIIPAFKAHKTIYRAVASIACQTIIDDVSVTIVNDCCPEGGYDQVVAAFEPCISIREIKLPKNGGPGVARQTGIDSTTGEYIVFLDADDSFLTVKALETLRDEIKKDPLYVCASAGFAADGMDHSAQMRTHKMMVWVFGKMYRRSFLDEFSIRFSPTRANEDSGFNHIVMMLCDGVKRKICFVEEYLYYYHATPDSITRVNKGQYFYDQCHCGGIDNIIYALEHVWKYFPFSQSALETTMDMMQQSYFYYTTIETKAPQFAPQLFEYVKKFYHRCYKRIESLVTDKVFEGFYQGSCIAAMRRQENAGVVPRYTIWEFMERVRTEPYDPELINEIREEMSTDPDLEDVRNFNIACGVCPEDMSDAIQI